MANLLKIRKTSFAKRIVFSYTIRGEKRYQSLYGVDPEKVVSEWRCIEYNNKTKRMAKARNKKILLVEILSGYP